HRCHGCSRGVTVGPMLARGGASRFAARRGPAVASSPRKRVSLARRDEDATNFPPLAACLPARRAGARGAWACAMRFERVATRRMSLRHVFFVVAVLGLLPASAVAQSDPDPVEQTEDVEAPRGSDPLRAAIEDAAFLLGGTLWYVIDERNVLDWDIESWDQRFSEDTYRFDNNHFPMNFLAHPLS